MPEDTILIQNYHPTATRALIRDFKKIGFSVYSPDSNWDRIAYFASNDGLGGTLISEQEYMQMPAGYALLTCKPHEEDIKSIARQHGDTIILNIAQHHLSYEENISDIMICPDIMTFLSYPSTIKHKLLYFLKPYIYQGVEKDKDYSFSQKIVRSYINRPKVWTIGYPLFEDFSSKYPHECTIYGSESPGGFLSPEDCQLSMAKSLFTAHFKEDESYGLSCIESMSIGTPIISLDRFVRGKTLGEFFLRDCNSIIANSVDELIDRVTNISYEQYVEMSHNAAITASELTSDESTVQRLAAAVHDARS